MCVEYHINILSSGVDCSAEECDDMVPAELWCAVPWSVAT
jgi:hypothetical protein